MAVTQLHINSPSCLNTLRALSLSGKEIFLNKFDKKNIIDFPNDDINSYYYYHWTDGKNFYYNSDEKYNFNTNTFEPYSWTFKLKDGTTITDSGNRTIYIFASTCMCIKNDIYCVFYYKERGRLWGKLNKNENIWEETDYDLTAHDGGYIYTGTSSDLFDLGDKGLYITNNMSNNTVLFDYDKLCAYPGPGITGKKPRDGDGIFFSDKNNNIYYYYYVNSNNILFLKLNKTTWEWEEITFSGNLLQTDISGSYQYIWSTNNEVFLTSRGVAPNYIYNVKFITNNDDHYEWKTEPLILQCNNGIDRLDNINDKIYCWDRVYNKETSKWTQETQLYSYPIYDPDNLITGGFYPDIENWEVKYVFKLSKRIYAYTGHKTYNTGFSAYLDNNRWRVFKEDGDRIGWIAYLDGVRKLWKDKNNRYFYGTGENAKYYNEDLLKFILQPIKNDPYSGTVFTVSNRTFFAKGYTYYYELNYNTYTWDALTWTWDIDQPRTYFDGSYIINNNTVYAWGSNDSHVFNIDPIEGHIKRVNFITHDNTSTSKIVEGLDISIMIDGNIWIFDDKAQIRIIDVSDNSLSTKMVYSNVNAIGLKRWTGAMIYMYPFYGTTIKYSNVFYTNIYFNDLLPVFLKESNVWNRKDAYIRQDNQWVQISHKV